MYGSHKKDYQECIENLHLHFKGEEDFLKYYREIGEDIVEKRFLNKNCEIVINPIEPLNLPKDLASTLLIELDEPVMVSPRSKSKIFAKFPIEIGVFVKGDEFRDPFDIFSLVNHKYTTYGDIKTGRICKYWKSDASQKIPTTDRYKEGVIQVNMMNTTRRWIEVTNMVFTGYGMKIYYDENMVSLMAKMIIQTEDQSETKFLNSGMRKGMRKSIETLRPKGTIPMKGEKFIMEGGI